MAYNPYSYPYYQYAPYNGSVEPSQRMQASQTGITWVQDRSEAERYPIAPNNVVVLWDINSPCIYRKQADTTGRPTMQIYDLVERKETNIEKSATEYATVGDLNNLKKEVAELKKAMGDHSSEQST